ncbi:MAG: hypothetical protein LBJ16_00025 [Holosporaceae bacterium]|jgi:hypothetical protein|nr:hypothetical protein [Holosporaceae bacterium]
MHALFGEKNLRMFDEEWGEDTRPPEFIPDDLGKYKLILDRSEIDFSLETLSNCSYGDARDALSCARKVSGTFEDVFLLPRRDFNIFKKMDFYLQKSAISGDLGKKLKTCGDLFPIECIIANFCKSVREIGDTTWWLYVAQHQSSGLKMVAGRGDGIVLSRLINCRSPKEISNALVDTRKYLGRFGMSGPLEVISTLRGIDGINDSSGVTFIEESDDVERTLLKFLDARDDIYPWGQRESYLRKTLRVNHKKICLALSCCIGLESMWLVNQERQCAELQPPSATSEKFSEKIVQNISSHLKFRINDHTLRQAEELLRILKVAKNPLKLLGKISAIINQNDIPVERLIMENCDSATINTSLDRLVEDKLQQLHSDTVAIQLEKSARGNAEYEKIDTQDSSGTKYGAVICIKAK